MARKILVRPNNPYSTGKIETFGDEQPILTRKKIFYRASEDDEFHQVIQEEDLTTISFKHYGDSKYYWVLADVNQIENPLDLTDITSIVMPSLDRVKVLAKRI